jgi:adenylate cyclase
VANELREAGIPVDRAAAFVLTLHPNIAGRAFWWMPGKPVRVGELTHGAQQSPMFQDSPVAAMFRQGREIRLRVGELEPPYPFAVVGELVEEGISDHVTLPLPFLSGQTHAITFATRRAGGFTDEHLAALRKVVRPLARIAEIMASRRTAANVLSTYVGRDAGERILAGRILRGDVETLRAVVWFSDLRSFTSMSSAMPPAEVIAVLNELFDCQVPPIERHGGEVLKFMGDGLLAIFPCERVEDTSRRCDEALTAADEAFAAIEARNAQAAHPLRFGVALHVGELAYGNIGGSARLDFTAIGSAVNLTARLEGLTSKLGQRLVVSEEFAGHTTRPFEPAGEFELKGVAGAARVYRPKA